VSRGRDWKWGDQDGGSGHVGRLFDITSWDHLTSPDGAKVVWDNLKSNVYRIGYRGVVSKSDIYFLRFPSYYYMACFCSRYNARSDWLISRNDHGTDFLAKTAVSVNK